MATYKLIQDIEAEDHILGPLTLRQFIFALIAMLCFYLSFILLAKHLDIFLILFLPVGIFFGFFAIPFGRDQPTEIWALAKIRYFIKPRRRIWNQSGAKELVTITAPKKIERFRQNPLSVVEVESRLKTLANTLDSRGWSVKNVPVGDISQQLINNANVASSDRLINVSSLPKQVPDFIEPVGADILDEKTSLIAQHFNNMIDESNAARRSNLLEEVDTGVVKPKNTEGSNSSNQWFRPHYDDSPSPVSAPVVNPKDESVEDKALSDKIKTRQFYSSNYRGNLRTLNPTPKSGTNSTSSNQLNSNVAQPQSPMTDKTDPAILTLANNDDLTVATIAREANRSKGNNSDGEVVIPLH